MPPLSVPVRTAFVALAVAVVVARPVRVSAQQPVAPPAAPVPMDVPDTSVAVGCTDPSGCVEAANGMRWALARNGEIPKAALAVGRMGTPSEPIPVYLCRAWFRMPDGQAMAIPGSMAPGSREPGCLVIGSTPGTTVAVSSSYEVLTAVPPGVGWVPRGLPPSGTPVRAWSVRGTCRHVLPNGQALAGGILGRAGCLLVFGGQSRSFASYDALESGVPVVAQETAPAPSPAPPARPAPPPPAVLALGHAMIVEIPGRDVFPQMIRTRKVQFTLAKRMRVALTAWEQPGGPRPEITMKVGNDVRHAAREFDRPVAELLLPALDAGTYEFELSEVSQDPAPSRAVRVAVVPTTWDVASHEVMIDLVNHPGAEREATVGYMALGDMAVAVTVRAPPTVMASLSRIALLGPDGRELASGPPPSVSLAKVPSGYNSTLHHVRLERSSDVTGPVIVQTIAERVGAVAANPPPVIAASPPPASTPPAPAGPARDGPPVALASIDVGQRLEAEFDAATAQLFERAPMQFYRIPCERGALLVVDVESSANATAVLLRAGQKVTQDEDGGRGTNARMFYACPSTGDVLVGARLYEVASGSFSVSVGRMSQPVVPATASEHILAPLRTVHVDLSRDAGTFRGYPARSYAFLCPARGAAQFSAVSAQGRQMQVTIFEPNGIHRSQISGDAAFRCDAPEGLYRVVIQGDNASTLVMRPAP